MFGIINKKNRNHEILYFKSISIISLFLLSSLFSPINAFQLRKFFSSETNEKNNLIVSKDNFVEETIKDIRENEFKNYQQKIASTKSKFIGNEIETIIKEGHF